MCKHYLLLLTEKDRHYVNSIKHNNCVLCLAEQNGPMLQSEIAEYLGISKMRVCQLIKSSTTKFKKRMKRMNVEYE